MTNPCGMPKTTGPESDLSASMATHCCLLYSKFLIQSKQSYSVPKLDIDKNEANKFQLPLPQVTMENLNKYMSSYIYIDTKILSSIQKAIEIIP